MALSFMMVLCLLVYRLAEFRLRSWLAETRAVDPRSGAEADRASHHGALVFQCFEGVELLHVQADAVSLTIVLRLQPLHRLILALLGPLYEQIYNPSG